jgi:hypothetical protein
VGVPLITWGPRRQAGSARTTTMGGLDPMDGPPPCNFPSSKRTISSDRHDIVTKDLRLFVASDIETRIKQIAAAKAIDPLL